MSNIVDKNRFIADIAERAGFTRGDVRIILDTMISYFEECVRNGVIIKIRGFGKTVYQKINERKITKGKYAGMILPPTTRITWRLAETIRFADRDDE